VKGPEVRRPSAGRVVGRGAAALALFAAATLQAPSTGAAGGTFRGVAAAEGLRVGVTAVGAPVTNNVVDGASPIAQAAVDSTSGSSALASVAYPGDVVVTTPGLLAGVSGGQLSGIPPYPLIATAGSTTTPEQKVEGPGSTMRAAAVDRRAEATARSGAAAAEGAPAPAWATSSTVEADDVGAVTARATSEVTGVTVGPLTLGRVTARSVVRRAPGGEPVRETSFDAAGLTIGEAKVALTPAGLVVAGTTTPVSATPLQAVLDGAGVSVRSLAADNTTDGVVSAGLVVSRTQQLPTAISPVTVSYTFGRAMAAVSATALAPIVSDVAVPPLPPPSPPDGTAGGDSTGSIGAGVGDAVDAGGGFGAGGVGGGGSFTGGSPLPATGSGPGPVGDSGAPDDGAKGGGATEAAGGQAPAVGSAVPVRRVGSRLFDLSTIYLLLVAAAATAGAVIQFMRHAGVRLWTSRPG
jgi:hypothetical protein